MTWSILQNNDGTIWFSRTGANHLLQFNPETKKFTSFNYTSVAPFQMKSDLNTGEIWYTALQSNKVGVVQKNPNLDIFEISEFDVGENTGPSGIVLDKSEDAVWVSQITDNKIVKFLVIRDEFGDVLDLKKSLEIPDHESLFPASPTDILILNDTLWTTEHGTSFLTEYDMSTKEWKRYPTSPLSQVGTSLPFWLRASGDNEGIWFNEHTGNRVAFFNLTDNTLTEYEIQSRPKDGFLVQILNIDTDPTNHDNLWFSEWNLGKIGVVDKSLLLPFEISSDTNIIEFESPLDKSKKTVKITLSKNTEFENLWSYGDHSKIHLTTSSSIGISGKLVNMTSSFPSDTIDLNEIENSKIINLTLTNDNMSSSNHTLAISASNGLVVKTIFLDMIIK